MMRVMSRLPFSRASVGRLAFELFLVFVAVFAALFANAYWQNRRDRAAAHTALQAFAMEMQRNRTEISNRIGHHGTVVTNARELLAAIARGEQPVPDVDQLRNKLTEGKGFGLPLLSRAAWDTALATQVLGHLPLATVQRLAGVYEQQKRLEALLERTIATFQSPVLYDAQRAHAAATSFLVTFGMLVELENDQQQRYADTLSVLPAP
jgi:cell division protein FtsB